MIGNNYMKTGEKLATGNYQDNFLENPLFASYFLTQELLAYHKSIKHIEDKRDNYYSIIPELEKFIELIKTCGDEALTACILSGNAKSLRGSKHFDKSLDEIECIDPVGYYFLDLQSPLTLETLKAAYRKSAMKHHPDKGGTNESMQIVNIAYKNFHEYLCLKIDVENDYSNLDVDGLRRIDTVNDCIYLYNVTLLEMYCDDWDLNKAFRIASKLLITNFFGVALPAAKVDHYALIQIVLSLTKKLASAKMIPEANAVLELCIRIYDVGGFHLNEYFNGPLNSVKKIIDGSLRYAFKINHLRQAKNALSFGVITQKKYDDIYIKISSCDDEIASIDEAFIGLTKSGCPFKSLPYDKGLFKTKISSKNIPGVSYFENMRIHELSGDQKSEYLEAFSENTSASLVRKYSYVRIVSFFMSIKTESSDDFLDKIIFECNIINHLYDSKRKNANTKLLLKNISLDLNAVRGCVESNRRIILEKLNLKYKIFTKKFNRYSTFSQ